MLWSAILRNIFNSTDNAIEDYYNFIEYLAIEGISDLYYRVADLIAFEEDIGGHVPLRNHP